MPLPPCLVRLLGAQQAGALGDGRSLSLSLAPSLATRLSAAPRCRDRQQSFRNAYVYESFSLKHLGLYAFHNFTSRSRLLSVTQISLNVA